MPDAKQNGDGSWSFSTQRGNANLKFKHNKNFGILDHMYKDEESLWNVPMRVVPSGDESEIIVTIVKPDTLTDDQFEERMKEINELFENLKQIIEKN